MIPVLLRYCTLVFLLLCTACATSSAGARARGDRNVITRAQLQEHNFRTAWDAVEALRSNWLLTKGTDSFQAPGQVQVYQDDNRVGGVEALRWISTQDIAYIRYYDGISASGRWGLNHGQGVIFVSTRDP